MLLEVSVKIDKQQSSASIWGLEYFEKESAVIFIRLLTPLASPLQQRACRQSRLLPPQTPLFHPHFRLKFHPVFGLFFVILALFSGVNFGAIFRLVLGGF